MSVLVLGGTAEARDLAGVLHDRGADVTTSLAGSVADPRTPAGRVRVGGFGGVDGLAAFLTAGGVRAVVDATHPFAARITAHAAQACARVGVPLLRLTRPSWATRPESGTWCWVDSPADAVRAAGLRGSRVFLAVGRRSLPAFAAVNDRFVLARVIDAPVGPVPPNWVVIRARGPFTLAQELELLQRHRIDVLVAKDSGGPTASKLDACAHLGVSVVMVRRPPDPPTVDAVASVAGALDWLRGRTSGVVGPGV